MSATEFARRMNLHGVEITYIGGGKRCMDVVIKVRGVEIARKSVVYTRGKVSSESYSLPEIAK